MVTINPNKPEKLSRPVSSPETIPSLESAVNYPANREKAAETPVEQPISEIATVEQDQPGLAGQSVADDSVSIHPIPKSITLRKIESILEDDLSDVYFRLDEAHQRLFKEEGERASRQIEAVLATGKSIAVKVLAIIKKWLQVIPGINKFFIEQEAKIKTDQITRINAGFPK
ncbi:MAG TPA: hypothetical protein P5267_02820 [Patescibacteria group bacterium]|nr:hypothetical protein [Patescibacteria group bacterium]